MAKRIKTADGRPVAVNDEVWTENHVPWHVVGIGEQVGATWVFLERDVPDHDSLMVAAADAPRLLYSAHPSGDCRRAGCVYQPWGERR